MIKGFTLKSGTDKTQVEAHITQVGSDLTVTIAGGDLYHIGAVAIGEVGVLYEGVTKMSAHTSVICLRGHKEDQWAYQAAKYLATSLDKTVVVTMGIHIDNIKKEEFKILRDNVDDLLEQIIKNDKELCNKFV